MKHSAFNHLVAAIAAGAALAAPALANTEVRSVYRNNTGVAADDFHFTVDNAGGSAVVDRKLVDRRVNSKAGQTTADWQNTGGAGNNTNTSADFDAGAAGAKVAAGADGDFWIKNNTNYIKITEAYWTVKGNPVRNANGDIIYAPLVGGGRPVEYSFNFSPNGHLDFDYGSIPTSYAYMLVKTGVAVGDLQSLADWVQNVSPGFDDFDALVGSTLFRDGDGGTFTGLQSYGGSPLTAGRGIFIYVADAAGNYGFAWSDGLTVAEPGTALLLLAAALSGLASRVRLSGRGARAGTRRG